MKSQDVRQSFISYFEKNKHQAVASSRLVPEGDPTLLFTNAGMNQFKNSFLGVEKRSYNRAVTSQKCVRAGGKHNDLENVGHTARHHTFFEMLGNFSFGDYFKKEAIHFAWEYITKDLGLPKDKLYVTVFEKDDDAADIWHKQEGVPKDRIYRFGEKDNFWRMGDTGPCGPCSEIFFDLGEDVPGDPKENVMGGNGDRFMEFWNLVFMQFYEDGVKQNPLPNPSIDTGMGLERLTAIMQGEISNYHTDLFQDIISVGAKLSGTQYLKSLKGLSPDEAKRYDASNVALRVLADHARASSFLIADGVLPSNEGRGYVLRRILRRAIRYGRNLSQDNSLLPPMVEAVIKKMAVAYPELQSQSSLILNSVKDEESRFLQTLDQGTAILTEEISKRRSRNQNVIDGDLLFKLYDTFGFPVDLTRIMASEEGFKTDEEGFEKKMLEARTKAKASWKGKGLSGDGAHLLQLSQKVSAQMNIDEIFTGYKTTSEPNAELIGLSNGQTEVQKLKAGESGLMIFNKTCFYAESGGQVGDTGRVQSHQANADVLDCTKVNGVHVHHVRVTEGEFSVKDLCSLQVEGSERRNIASNHSATHLLHSALREVLGPRIQQAGSLVEADRLRFDFTHNKPISKEELEQIERLVNREIAHGNSVSTETMTPDEAVKKGALALFGEKYGDKVRVIQMGPFSMELCGGTHVSNTSMIRLFKIVSESGVSAGVRRIEALTGDKAFEYLMKNTQENMSTRESLGLPMTWTTYLESDSNSAAVIASLKEQLRQKDKEIQSLKGGAVSLEDILKSGVNFEFNGEKGILVLADIQVDDRKVLSDLTDKLKDKVQSGLVVVVGKGEGSHPVIVSVSKNLAGKINAGQVLKSIAEAMGGKGGGRSDFAQGAVPDRSQLPQAFEKARAMVGL